MEYLQNGFTYLLDKPYGWIVLVVAGVVIVATVGFGVLDAKAKGYTVSQIVDTAVERTVAKVKQVPSKLAKVVVGILTSKHILSIIKKGVTKIVHAISEDEVKAEVKDEEEK